MFIKITSIFPNPTAHEVSEDHILHFSSYSCTTVGRPHQSTASSQAQTHPLFSPQTKSVSWDQRDPTRSKEYLIHQIQNWSWFHCSLLSTEKCSQISILILPSFWVSRALGFCSLQGFSKIWLAQGLNRNTHLSVGSFAVCVFTEDWRCWGGCVESAHNCRLAVNVCKALLGLMCWGRDGSCP